MTPEEAYWKSRSETQRNLELEKLILKSSIYTFYYIENVIKVPWEEGEDVICKNPIYSISYAKRILEGPFEKCHPYIFNSDYRDIYYRFLLLINYDVNKIKEWLI